MFDLMHSVQIAWKSFVRAGRKEKELCRIKFKPCHGGLEASIDCSECHRGSSMSDPECRGNILSGLSGRGGVCRILLEKNFVREYSGESLNRIMDMASFCDDLKLRASAFRTYGCGRCDTERNNAVSMIVDRSFREPLEASADVETLSKVIKSRSENDLCRHCSDGYTSLVRDMMVIRKRLCLAMTAGYGGLMPYVRPGFSRSRILIEPPPESSFIRSYEVETAAFAPPLHVSIYRLPDSLEKLYFIIPWEYSLDSEDLLLIMNGREALLRKRPEEVDFLEALGSRQFFVRHAKESISRAAIDHGTDIDAIRLERLTSALVRYTCGLGILEDVLSDSHIQDAYVNAPVGMSPLHVVVDGEECTSNIYLSESDVESMISRLRAISGRPFSEASPVLDMDLGEFHTRVSAIGDPLSNGLAYAFRRHKKTPWTLPQLINFKMISPYAAGLLSFLVDGQSSMLITGTRGAGKTSLLGSLLLEIPQSYRILVIEDTPELPVEDMQWHGWKVQGIGTRAAVSGSRAEFQASDALRAALRLGESALIIGEVRGSEARSLYEAMRVGASGNSVMGTIHGSSCRDVFERVVHDIGVPPASFKATDAVVVCSTVRPKGSTTRSRRVMQIAEVAKARCNGEDVFNDLLAYDALEDMLVSSDVIDTGQSEAMRSIAKKWGISLEEACLDVRTRGEVRQYIANAGMVLPWIMEAGSYARCLNMYRVICEGNREEHGSIDHGEVLPSWKSWFDLETSKGA